MKNLILSVISTVLFLPVIATANNCKDVFQKEAPAIAKIASSGYVNTDNWLIRYGRKKMSYIQSPGDAAYIFEKYDAQSEFVSRFSVDAMDVNVEHDDYGNLVSLKTKENLDFLIDLKIAGRDSHLRIHLPMLDPRSRVLNTDVGDGKIIGTSVEQ